MKKKILKWLEIAFKGTAFAFGFYLIYIGFRFILNIWFGI